MKHLQLAIASIVDSNTGFGLVHDGDTRDISAYEKRAHEIRGRSVGAVFRVLRDSVASLGAAYRERSRQRRALAALSGLSDYYLEDIGLTRGDIAAVELGQVSLESLNAERRVRLSTKTRALAEAGGVENVAASASNEDSFVAARCA